MKAHPTTGPATAKGLLSDGALYGGGVLLGRALGFLMIPVYTRVLSAADYGRLDLLDTTANVLFSLVGSGITMAVLHEYEKHDDPAHQERVAATAVLGLGALGLAVTALLWFAGGPLAVAVLHRHDQAAAFRLIFATASMYGLVEVPMMIMRVRLQATRFVTVSIVRTLAGLALNIVLVVWLRQGLMGLVWSNFVTTLAFALVLALPILRRPGARFDGAMLRAMLRYGAPAVPGSLSMLLVHNGDRFILIRLVPLAAVGTYSLGYKFGMMITYVVGVPVYQAWTGRMWRICKQPDGPHVVARVGMYYAYGLLFAWLGLANLARELVALAAPPEFAPAADIIPVVALAYVVREWSAFSQTGLLVTARTRPIALIEPLSAVCNLVLTWFLVRHHGAFGAGVATLGTMLVFMGLMVTFSLRAYPVHHPWGRLAAALGLALGLHLVARWMPVTDRATAIVLKLGLTLAFLPLAVALRLPGPGDTARLRARLAWF